MLAHFIDSKPFQCGYFKDQESLFEEYLLEDMSEIEFEYLLAHGMRHFGDYYFRPRCHDCYQCIPIRVRAEDFKITRRQKRALRSCENVMVKMGVPKYTDEKFDLYIRHKKKFSTLQDDVEDEQNFRLSFYVNTNFGVEFEYYINDKLVGVALGDHTSNTFSAIYTFYYAEDSKLSLGTFSILKQLEFCQQKGVKFFYLGYYIGENQSLKYKGDFRPKNNVLWRNTDTLVKAKVEQSQEQVNPSKRNENLFF